MRERERDRQKIVSAREREREREMTGMDGWMDKIDRTLYLTCCQDIIKTQETLSSAPRIDDSRTCQKEVFLLNSRRQLLLTVRNKPQ